MPACEEIDGEDEEIVMTVLGSLEDLLYEPISIGGDSSDSSDDDAWNSCESKEGHSLRDEIATFADRAMAPDRLPVNDVLAGLTSDFALLGCPLAARSRSDGCILVQSPDQQAARHGSARASV